MKIIQPLLNKSSGLMKRFAGQFKPSSLDIDLSLAAFHKKSGDRSAASVQEEEHPDENSLRSKEHAQWRTEDRKKKDKKEQDKRVAALIGAGIIPQDGNPSFRSRVDSNANLPGKTISSKSSSQDWEHKITHTSSNPSPGLGA